MRSSTEKNKMYQLRNIINRFQFQQIYTGIAIWLLLKIFPSY